MLAEDAFDAGKSQLGEALTALALRYLDGAYALQNSASPPPAKPERPVVQQQKQVQPKDDK